MSEPMVQVTSASGPPAKVAGFGAGVASLFRGVRFVYGDHRELARYYLPPMMLAVLFVAGAWIGFWLTVDDIINWVWQEPAADAWWGVKHFLWSAAAFLLWIILAYVVAVSTVFLFSLLAAPFADFLSERVEGINGTWTLKAFSLKFLLNDLGQTVAFELMRFWLKLRWLVPLFIVSLLIPVVGHLVYVGWGGYILCKYTGMDYIDWCAARRGWSWRDRLAFAKRHRLALAGLGTPVVLSLMVPLLFVLVWPAAVAGGALLFQDLRRTEEPGTLTRAADTPELGAGKTKEE
jgi:CysZ protein